MIHNVKHSKREGTRIRSTVRLDDGVTASASWYRV